MSKTIQQGVYSLFPWSDGTNRSYPPPVAATPTFSPVAGSYATAQSVTISCATGGATIYYTLDGTDPSFSSPVYTSPITVNVTETIKAIADVSPYKTSAVGSAAYTITTAAAATPTFSPAAGTYATAQTVSISCSTPSSTIYYTTDGSTPTTASTVYTTAITVSASEIVQAIATAAGFVQSSVGSAAYTIGTIQGTYLAAGHWITKQPLRLVYPRPDAETNTWARHHFAYWDGTTGLNYRIPITVDFGGYPYLYQLISGPAGMSIVLPNTGAGHSPPYPDAYVTWTPTGVVTNQTVKVRVFSQDYQNDPTQYVDVVWTVSTSSTAFVFVDSSVVSSGTGTISSPFKQFTDAFGSTASASLNATTIAYFRSGGGVAYTVPVTTTGSGCPYYALNTGAKPSAIIGYPGDTLPKFDMSAASFGIDTGNHGADLFIQDIDPDGYQASSLNSRLMWAFAGASHRQVYDGIQQTNAGYGSSGGSNAGGIFLDAPFQYVTINNCTQSWSQTAAASNNYGMFSQYHATDVAVHGCSINQPNLSLAGAFYLKSDSVNNSVRGNVCIVQGSAHAFSIGQDQTSVTQNNESCYNIGVNVNSIKAPAAPNYTMGDFWGFRNNIIGSNGFYSWQPNYNLMGPYPLTATPTTGTGSLAAGTYYYNATTYGVTGESVPKGGTNAAKNEVSATLSVTGEITISISPIALGSGTRIYRGTVAGGENQYIDIGTASSFVDDGTGVWTSASPPTTNTATSAARFAFDSNVVQTPATAQTGSTIEMSNNSWAASGLLDTTTGKQIATPNGLIGAEIA